ncbi:MAG TPA: hypothetical protein VGT05_05330 [Patescibacteria group bacterium]|nr:hypothetical protein [Patescibacteria group bacterium]
MLSLARVCMTYDCFTFYNELELLSIRLHELDSVVDKFVLVEGTVTFTNKKKKLFFEENKNKFGEFKNKIIHVIVDDNPETNNPWEIERFQFNAIKRGLQDAEKGDIIMLSCVDEIPRAELVNIWSKKDQTEIKVFLQRLSYYYLNYVRADNNFWEGTKMVSKAQLSQYVDLYTIRQNPAKIRIPESGWHFSYMGGVEKIQQKISSFSHTELNSKKFNNSLYIQSAMKRKHDLYGNFILFKVTGMNSLPPYIRENKEKFSHLLSKDKHYFSDDIDIFLKKAIFFLTNRLLFFKACL